MNSHLPPCLPISSSVGSPPVSGSRRTSASTTGKPSAASLSAIALPIPEDDPVTIAEPVTRALSQPVPPRRSRELQQDLPGLARERQVVERGGGLGCGEHAVDCGERPASGEQRHHRPGERLHPPTFPLQRPPPPHPAPQPLPLSHPPP